MVCTTVEALCVLRTCTKTDENNSEYRVALYQGPQSEVAETVTAGFSEFLQSFAASSREIRTMNTVQPGLIVANIAVDLLYSL